MLLLESIIIIILAVFSAYLYLQKEQKISEIKKDFEEKLIKFKREEIEKYAKELLRRKFKDAQEEAQELRESAKQFYEKVKKSYKSQLAELEERERLLDTRAKKLEEKERELLRRQEMVSKREGELVDKLEDIAKLTKEEAKNELLQLVKREVQQYRANALRKAKEKIEAEAKHYAQELLVDTMQSIAVDFVDETTVSRVEIPNEDIKGKIIGKDGRNIRAFEKATGVDLIVDEAPNYIGLSSFDPVRREIARIALERLIKDGRIHPGTIEEYVKLAKREIAKELEKAGRELLEKAGWYDAPKELYPILGRMKFRRSLGQNLYKHVLEVLEIAGYIAKELGLSEEEIKKLNIAVVLHDVGKVFTSKIKKPHHFISADLARKYNLDDEIVNAIEAHHGDIESTSIIGEILKIADAISGARPGARKENLENYVERIESLEKKALEVAGDRAEDIYALKAGRELRVIVKPNKVSDDEAVLLARDIAKEIEKSGIFPGEVNVVVIKELRAHAKASKR